jgi:hypothetical protein
MIASLIAIAALVLVSSRATDGLRTAQLASILSRLPPDEARAYYAALKRRFRKVAVLRAIALVSLVCLLYAFRRHLRR